MGIPFLKKRPEIRALLLIFAGLILLRLPHLALPPCDYHAWRQSDTEAIARHFARGNGNILYPQFNYDGPGPNYVQLELQIIPYLTSFLYKAWGYQYFLPRSVSLVFFLGSAFFLYLLAKKIYRQPTALVALTLYGITPLNIFISRAIMPEAALLFFYLGALYLFWRWLDAPGQNSSLWPAIMASLAILEKPPSAVILAPILYLALQKGRGFILKNKYALIMIFLLPFIVPALYFFVWMPSIAKTQYVSGIAAGVLWSNLTNPGFSEEARLFLTQSLPGSFTYTLMILAVLGLLTIKGDEEMPLLLWTYAVLAEVLCVVAVIKLDYYLVLAGPLLALWGARFVAAWPLRRWQPVLTVLSVLLLLVNAAQTLPVYNEIDTGLLMASLQVEKHTHEEDLLVIGSLEPQLLNLSHRRGWRAGQYYPREPARELDFFIKQGAGYYVALPRKNAHTEEVYELYRRYLEAVCPGTPLPGGAVLYNLQELSF